MCGRVEIRYDQEVFISILDEINKKHPGYLFKSGELFPSEPLPVLHYEDGKYTASMVNWGYKNSFNKLLINARSETLDKRVTFKDDFRFRRVIIPVTGFYEWAKNKDKYYYESPNNELLYLGGLINKENNQVIIITKQAEEPIKHIHDRSPLIIDKADRKKWLLDLDFSKNLLAIPNKVLINETKV